MNEKTIHTGAACCDDCAKTPGACCTKSAVKVVRVGEAAPTPAKYIRVHTPEGMRYVLDGRGVRQYAVSDGARAALCAAGIRPDLRSVAAVEPDALTPEVYTALAEVLLSQVRYVPERGAWEQWPSSPGGQVRVPATPPRPELGLAMFLNGDQVRWLLMGGLCQTQPSLRR